jgi:unspecific monooxygenase
LLAEGKAWKNSAARWRRPCATRDPLLVPHMLAATDDAIGTLRMQTGVPIDLREAMQRLALDIAGRTMFSFEVEKHGAALRGFVNEYGERLAQPRFSICCCRRAGPAHGIFPAPCSAGAGRASWEI